MVRCSRLGPLQSGKDHAEALDWVEGLDLDQRQVKTAAQRSFYHTVVCLFGTIFSGGLIYTRRCSVCLWQWEHVMWVCVFTCVCFPDDNQCDQRHTHDRHEDEQDDQHSLHNRQTTARRLSSRHPVDQKTLCETFHRHTLMF